MNPGHEEPLGKNEFIEKRKTNQNKTTQQSLLSLLPENCETNGTLPTPSKFHSQVMNSALVHYTGILKHHLESPGNLFCWRKKK